MTKTTKPLSDKSVRAVAKLFAECDEDQFPICEIMMRNILNDRVVADASKQLERISK